ncbi:MAG: LuxR C-terminal-related transcriptional regulator [Cyclobacteriaceae bacterium]
MQQLSTDLVEKTTKMHPWHRQSFDEKLARYKPGLCPVARWQHTMNIGPAFLFIYDYHAQRYIYVSEEVEEVLGYTSKQFSQQGISFLIQQTKDEEAQYQMLTRALRFLQYNQSEQERTHCSVNLDFQCKRADGHYIHLLQQSIEFVSDRAGNLLYSMEKVTDISHRPPETSPMLSIFSAQSQKSLIYVPREEMKQKRGVFTRSEMRILQWLNRGYNTQEIADRAGLSPNTVATHRKNMLRKAKVSNTPKLVRFAKLQELL